MKSMKILRFSIRVSLLNMKSMEILRFSISVVLLIWNLWRYYVFLSVLPCIVFLDVKGIGLGVMQVIFNLW